MSFSIKTTIFEGPLDLLLDLIEKRKLFISDISLAKVTDDFIAHIRQYEHMPMGESAHFILIASTLLLIKSKSLLPELALTEEEKGDIQDLEARLKIYKRIKEAGIHVQKLFGAEMIFSQSHTRPVTPVFTPAPEFTLEKSLSLLKDLINRLPKKESLPKHVVQKVISLEQMIDSLKGRITSALRMSFRDFSSLHQGERVNVIVGFLAMLELVKDGLITAQQEHPHEDIIMETGRVEIPHY